MMDKLTHAIRNCASEQAQIVVLTGAGISAESGIPTFRGPEGYWTVGSREYRPEEMATARMFGLDPDAVWQWYLYRLGVCRAAQPNAGHRAVFQMEATLGSCFTLITQNVDGLHNRAGNSNHRTYQIHGNINYMRCASECSPELYTIPDEVKPKQKREPLSDGDRKALRCPRCGDRARPHVLWFDECYDETHYRYQSSIETAAHAAILLTVGTSGATNLPMQVGILAARRGAFIIDVNPSPNPFSDLAQQVGGIFIQGVAGEALPRIAKLLEDLWLSSDSGQQHHQR